MRALARYLKVALDCRGTSTKHQMSDAARDLGKVQGGERLALRPPPPLLLLSTRMTLAFF